ncbi:hypothetical protein OS242_13030 [Tumebacillus sp. DT12]|uniref:Uncharacterized protein n=1 Tax=Tumebacillus lacus TaxID=2995335 RepID=A0ABT3X361_9BACL|nr:hypothetical protein [Tumebacillus lacus]MCX7570881.1 hypothetical protein [Tumebacillus lacus]
MIANEKDFENALRTVVTTKKDEFVSMVTEIKDSLKDPGELKKKIDLDKIYSDLDEFEIDFIHGEAFASQLKSGSIFPKVEAKHLNNPEAIWDRLIDEIESEYERYFSTEIHLIV